MATGTDRLANEKLQPADDRRRLSRLLAVTALAAGLGTMFIANTATYGPQAAVPEPGSSFPFGVFAGLLLVHVALYVVSGRLRPSMLPVRESLPVWAYTFIQMGLAVALTRAADGAFPCVFFFVVIAAQQIGFEPCRWPGAVLTSSFFALLSMGSYPMQGAQVVGIMALLTMCVLTVQVVSFLRESVARREAATLLAELHDASAALNGYADDVEHAALANERQRMARELHDTLAQGLVGVTLQLEAADSYLGADGAPKARTILRQALCRARETLAEARQAIDGLRAPEAQTALQQALQREASRFSTATGVPCTLDADVPANLSSEIAEQLHRVVTEALTNVARHAQAEHVEVIVSRNDDSMTVRVVDDGIGFGTAASGCEEGHYGLLGLEERARALGGSFAVDSAPGQGTSVRFEVPVPR